MMAATRGRSSDNQGPAYSQLLVADSQAAAHAGHKPTQTLRPQRKDQATFRRSARPEGQHCALLDRES